MRPSSLTDGGRADRDAGLAGAVAIAVGVAVLMLAAGAYNLPIRLAGLLTVPMTANARHWVLQGSCDGLELCERGGSGPRRSCVR